MPKRLTWPEEEWFIFSHGLDAADPAPVRTAPTSNLPLEEAFRASIGQAVGKHVGSFVAERCTQRSVGSPDLRRLAPLALWLALAHLAEEQLIQQAAVCREHNLPWSAIAEIAGYQAGDAFSRRYREQVEDRIKSRASARQRGYELEGGPDWP